MERKTALHIISTLGLAAVMTSGCTPSESPAATAKPTVASPKPDRQTTVVPTPAPTPLPAFNKPASDNPCGEYSRTLRQNGAYVQEVINCRGLVLRYEPVTVNAPQSRAESRPTAQAVETPVKKATPTKPKAVPTVEAFQCPDPKQLGPFELKPNRGAPIIEAGDSLALVQLWDSRGRLGKEGDKISTITTIIDRNKLKIQLEEAVAGIAWVYDPRCTLAEVDQRLKAHAQKSGDKNYELGTVIREGLVRQLPSR